MILHQRSSQHGVYCEQVYSKVPYLREQLRLRAHQIPFIEGILIFLLIRYFIVFIILHLPVYVHPQLLLLLQHLAHLLKEQLPIVVGSHLAPEVCNALLLFLQVHHAEGLLGLCHLRLLRRLHNEAVVGGIGCRGCFVLLFKETE